ncbi:MAG TPA: hypothetical protein VMM56_14365 [Planctomycetaceae bacterium]|nr:hypothetical protein [Planctomycetaceae bacterium]
MSEPEAEPENRTKSRWGCGCLGLVMLLVGYILSPGPLILVCENCPGSVQPMLEPVIEYLYLPLGWCYDNYESVEIFYDWYFELLGVY